MTSSRSRRLASLAIAASLVALTACAGNPPAQPTPGAPTGATGSGSTTPAVAGPGQGVIRGQVSAEGIAAGAFRTLLQASGGKGKVKATSAVDTREVECGPDGKFECVVKGGGEYTLEASIPDGKGGVFKVVSDKKITVPLANDPPIVDAPSLVTRRTGSIQGVVSLKEGKPGDTAEGADVFLSGGTSVVGKCGETGRFALTNVAEGTWNLVVMKPGYKRVVVKDVAVKAGKPRLLDTPVVLERETSDATAGIKGVVQSSTGGAVAGATIAAFPKDRSKLVGNDAALDNFTAISDDQGAFELLSLPPGEYEVQVYRPFYQLPPRVTATVKAGAPADMGTIKLASTVLYFGKVAGLVLDERGKPVDGAVIQLDPPVTDAQFADARGNFTLDRILPGEYNLHIAAGGYTPVVVPIVVENAQSFELALGKRIMPANAPLPTEGKGPSDPPPLPVPPAPDPIGANPDVYLAAGDDPGTAAPGPVTGPLTPAGTASTDERFGRVVVNLGGLVDPATMQAIALGKADVTLVEDDTVKAFKFTDAEDAGRSLPVDIGMIVDVTGSMGGTLAGVKASCVKFIEDLYARNIDAQVGAVAYSDGLSGNPGRLSPATDPAAMTVTGFEYLTPFVDADGLKTPPTGERTLRANRVTTFLDLLTPSGGMDWPEGMLDSLWWAQANGQGTSQAGASRPTFGWRPHAQRVYVAMTDASVWEAGGPEISPSSPWTVPALAARLRDEKAVVHMVSNDLGGYAAHDRYGDPKGLAVAMPKASSTGAASVGTGGSWTQLPGDGVVDLSKLPVATILGNSVKLEFISFKAAATPEAAKEHAIRLIVRKDGKAGETLFKLKY